MSAVVPSAGNASAGDGPELPTITADGWSGVTAIGSAGVVAGLSAGGGGRIVGQNVLPGTVGTGVGVNGVYGLVTPIGGKAVGAIATGAAAVPPYGAVV